MTGTLFPPTTFLKNNALFHLLPFLRLSSSTTARDAEEAPRAVWQMGSTMFLHFLLGWRSMLAPFDGHVVPLARCLRPRCRLKTCPQYHDPHVLSCTFSCNRPYHQPLSVETSRCCSQCALSSHVLPDKLRLTAIRSRLRRPCVQHENNDFAREWSFLS